MDNSYYYQTTTTTSGDPAIAGAMLVFLGFVGLVSYIIVSIFLGMLFKKAGKEQWKAWVPVLNSWTFLELGGQKGWLSLFLLLAWIPLIGFVPALVFAVFMAIAAYKIGESLGKEGVFVLLYIFLPLVWVIWLAVDKSAVWKKKEPGAQRPAAAANDA